MTKSDADLLNKVRAAKQKLREAILTKQQTDKQTKKSD